MSATAVAPALGAPDVRFVHLMKASMLGGAYAGLSASAFFALMCIKCHCDLSTGATFPSVDTICRLTGLARGTVVRALSDLADGGHIEREERRRGQRAAYRVIERVPLRASGAAPEAPAAVAAFHYRPEEQQAMMAALRHCVSSGTLPAADGDGVIHFHLHIHQHQHVEAGAVAIQSGGDVMMVDERLAAARAWLATLPIKRRMALRGEAADRRGAVRSECLAPSVGWEVEAWEAAGCPAAERGHE